MQVNVYIFSTNSLQQLKKFRFRKFERYFFQFYFFNAFFWGKWTFWARPVGKMNTQMQVLWRCSVFFFHFGTFLQEKSEANTFDWNHRLKNSGQELKSTEEFTGKIQGHSHYLWPVRTTFWMSSCREPTCPLFWLEQELHVEGEQVKYFKVQFSFVVFRSNARSHNRHPFHDHSDGRRVAEMSCDSKYIIRRGLNS